jgi:capsular exopolysaccharide synthesis family protein
MSHLALALRRAAATAKGLQRSEVDVLTEDLVKKSAIGLRTARPGDSQQAKGPGDRGTEPGVELHTHLPTAVASQLASLAQAIEQHPAKPRTIAFVGSGRNEGTSTCVANMASYLVNRRSRVLMIDANLHWPSLHKLAGVDREGGLLEMMAGEIDLRTAVKPASVRGLWILTSGGMLSEGSNALVVPAAFRERILDLTKDFDYVLVDCPAVNAHEEAAMTAATCDAVVLVIEGGKTLREEAQASKAILTRARCPILGVLMNKRRFYVPQFLYDRL